MDMRLPLRHTLCTLLLTLTALSLPSLVEAQGGYFGRNKVQYQNFDFKILKTDHFDIYYYSEEEDAARMASRLAERWYARLSTLAAGSRSSCMPAVHISVRPTPSKGNSARGLAA
jgi:hypothetical protein